MSRPLTPLRLLLALALLIAGALLLHFLLSLTEHALSVWERLQQTPVWLRAVYVNAVGIGLLALAWVIWRVLRPGPRRAVDPAAALDEPGLQQRVAALREQGLDTAAAERELAELGRRREAGEIHVALFGEINAGKSSLIRALLPPSESTARIETSPRGGATRAITHHTWTRASGDRVLLADLPGLNEADGALDPLARDEARRAQLVVYVCDGDLSRSQWRELEQLRALDKPLILALNKSDRYTPEELERLAARLRERLAGEPEAGVVTVSAGGTEELIRERPDGGEERVQRTRAPHIASLREAMQRRIDRDPATLDRLRDATVFQLAAAHLDAEQARHRRARAQAIVEDHTRKAIAAALAAIAPGTDLILQGALGYAMLKALCELYDVPLRRIDADDLLKRATSGTRRRLPLVLAILGNGLKAFPGLGTLGGGALHAIAYGLIFDSLGNAVRETLESRGELRPLPTMRRFEERLGETLANESLAEEPLEGRTRRIAELALRQLRAPRDTDR